MANLLILLILLIGANQLNAQYAQCSLVEWIASPYNQIGYCYNAYEEDLQIFKTTKSILKEFKLSHSHFRNIAANNFEGFTNLLNLTIHDSEIKSIEKHALSHFPNLEILDLSLNELYELNNHFFEDLTNLTDLILNDNFIRIIDSYTFSNLINLRNLELKNNDLHTIDRQLFAGLENVEIIDLSGNPILSIDNKAFDSCLSLKKIILEKTQENLITDSLSSIYSNIEINFVISERMVQHRFNMIMSEEFEDLKKELMKYQEEPTKRKMHSMAIMEVNKTSFGIFLILIGIVVITIVFKKKMAEASNKFHLNAEIGMLLNPR